MKKKIFTNCFLVKLNDSGRPEKICLAMKKRGFGQGMWNGSGGKPQDNETMETAARREVEEELGVRVTEMKERGEIDFVLRQEDQKTKMFVFLVTEWKGEPSESEEMRPEWFAIDKIPYDQMWASDREWLPLVLTEKIRAKYTYAHEGGRVEKREVMSNFREDLYKLLTKIPEGKVTTYKILAEKLGSRGYRAVGQALKNNKNAPTIPCHRVVRSDGKIGGYMGDKIQRKIELLKREGVEVYNGCIKDFDKKLWKD